LIQIEKSDQNVFEFTEQMFGPETLYWSCFFTNKNYFKLLPFTNVLHMRFFLEIQGGDSRPVRTRNTSRLSENSHSSAGFTPSRTEPGRNIKHAIWLMVGLFFFRCLLPAGLP